MPGALAGDIAACGESEMLALAKQGNDEALAALLARFEGYIHAKASSLKISGFETEDFIQEGKIGFVSAVRNYDSRRSASFRTYAFLCISSRMMSAARAASRKKHWPLNGYVSLDDMEITGEMASLKVVDPEDMIVSQENISAIKMEIMHTLSPVERKVLFLYLSGFSYAIIANELNVGSKFIDNALQRMRKKLSLKMAV